MSQPDEPRSAPTIVDPAARNEGPPDLDNPFKDPTIPPPLVFPSGSREASRSPVAMGRVARIDTGRGTANRSPVSPVVCRSNLQIVERIERTATNKSLYFSLRAQ